MNTISQLNAIPLAKIHPKEIPAFIYQYAEHIKVLSLDCFDTILWRKAATPIDVFFQLQNQPTFKALGLDAMLRVSSESRARYKRILSDNSNEVTLKQIYLEYLPFLGPEQLNELAEEEIKTELEFCYAFPSIVELIRVAHQLGIIVVVVSDTYLQEFQLRRLLSTLLPADAFAAITKIFCSCEYGKSKSNGLFLEVLRYLTCTPQMMLHLGDNLIADYKAPSSMGINAAHFQPHSDVVAEMKRLQTIAAKVLNPNIGSTLPMPNYFDGIFTAKELSVEAPETFIGYASLGPILLTFAKFIFEEIEQLKLSGKRPKVLFLMRDAYLPAMACEALTGGSIGHCVRISRFAAFAASFRTKDDIENYIIDVGTTTRFEDLCRQFLLPPQITEMLINEVKSSAQPISSFMALIHRPEITELIFQASARYRKRLIHHLEKTIGLTKGDTLMFVDLGYSGTAQRRLAPVFLEELKVEIIGRYLISLRTPQWEYDRRGLLDPSWCDDRALLSHVLYISLLEQLCTSYERSVVDYDEVGNPIYSDVKMSDQQLTKLKAIQDECLRFIHDAKYFFQSINFSPSSKMLRQSAAIELARMIYFPTQTELKCLRSFQAEMNLGTNEVFDLFNPEEGLTELKRRGLIFIEKKSTAMRTNYPAELRTAGIELALSLLTQVRFGLRIQISDMALRKKSLPITFIQGTETHHSHTDALITHDGYYAAWLPAGVSEILIVQFGQVFNWLQLESAEFIHQETILQQNEAHPNIDARPVLSFQHMTERDKGLYECSERNAAMLIHANSFLAEAAQFVLRVVFRPIVEVIQ